MLEGALNKIRAFSRLCIKYTHLFIQQLISLKDWEMLGHVNNTTSACCVSSVSEDCLTSDPLTFGAEEFDNRCYILHICQTSLHRTALMVSYCFWRFLRIEECCLIVRIVAK
jgi:hypothetical protein